MKTFSIIIAVKEFNKNLEKCLEGCLNLDHKNYEIIVLPDLGFKRDSRIKQIVTGNVSPAEKRDIGAEYSDSEILAFIDDDAFPREDWLKKAEKYFQRPDTVAVGGPGVEHPNDSKRQKASDLVLSSFIGSGSMRRRYKPGKEAEIIDHPTCNLFIRKKAFESIGGFDTKYWPGEDTKLCNSLVKSGRKIVYAPDIVVYHHRRNLFKPHLKQIWRYGFYRGVFAKRFPETSRKVSFFLPSVLVLLMLFGWLSVFINNLVFYVYASFISIYLLASFLTAIRNVKFFYLTFPGIISTHIVYGIAFIHGIFK
ncbi:MAG: glycosyltransferase [Candidatus Aenigmarchaeota archaeon]|nr:glycosyltransferase [Candidatus Aenigmarchaeota archaeon]